MLFFVSDDRQKRKEVNVETVVSEYDDITFRRMFILKKLSVEIILQKISGRLIYEQPL